MKGSIFIKVYAGFLIIILLLATLILVFSIGPIREFHLETLSDNLERLAIAFRSKTSLLMREGRIDELDRLVKELGEEMQARITVIAPDGRVLADSEEHPPAMEKHDARHEIAEALSGRIGRSRRYSTTVGADMFYVAVPVILDGEIAGVLRTSFYLEEVDRLSRELIVRIVQMSFVVVLIASLLALLLSRTVSTPVGELSSASRRLAWGDFDVRVHFRGEDELKELAVSFNNMAETMKNLFEQVSSQKEELDNIIASIREGLTVIDREGTVVLANRGFKDIIEDDDIEGKLYRESIRDPSFGELVRKVQSRQKSVVEEIELQDRVFLCSATLLNVRQDIVVMVHDITEIRKLEKIKRDFVTNVSHELRTPLTVIKGFAETLLEGADRENRNALEVIVRHTDRLVSIVNDLLALSELEERNSYLQTEEVDLRAVIEHILTIFEQRLKEKGLSVTINAGDSLSTVRADPYRIEQMFINLLDNAIKYTESGGITIDLEQGDTDTTIVISDTGIGISEKHRSRIFERFYVTDKSRSRRLGGTGLGLSIVKHIVLLHGGRITVESEPGVGSRFTIILPRIPVIVS